MPFSDRLRAAAERLVARYPVSRSALLPLLHLVQSEEGYVSRDGIAFCAELLGLTRAEVAAVATFYTMFKTEPVGDWLLSVCTNPVCKVAGGSTILRRYRDRLGGDRDPEGRVTVEEVECLGVCDAAPVVQVNYENYGPLDLDAAEALLDACLAGQPPASPLTGTVPPSFREVEWELSGAGDPEELQRGAEQAAARALAAPKPPTLRSGETDLPVTFPGVDPARMSRRA